MVITNMGSGGLGSSDRRKGSHAESAVARFDTGFLLVEVTRLMRELFDARMRPLGLTGSTRRVISYLAKDDGQTQVALARKLEISRVALGEAVDRLERSGHVERRADPADRRKWRVHLTARARDLLPTMFAAADALQTEYFRDVSAHDLAALQATLGRLRARLLEMKAETMDDEGAE
jgi:MarR family transcriptional regulator, transcriptional regulator for hemolysin